MPSLGGHGRLLAGPLQRWGYLLNTPAVSDPFIESAMERYDIIAVTGCAFSGDGRLAIKNAPLLKRLMALSIRKKVTVYPVVSFTSAEQGARLLKDGLSRSRAILDLIRMCGQLKLRGIHLDFEYLPRENARLLAAFLSELRSRYRGTVTMAVFPQVEFPEKWSRFHDLEMICPHLDGIVIMCYDLHGLHTGPGPVTDVKWADKNIRHALKFMKPGSIWLGIPAYGYRWTDSCAGALSAHEGVRLSRNHNAQRDGSGNLTFSYPADRGLTRVYISDRQTRTGLEELARGHNLAGVSVWRIGFED